MWAWAGCAPTPLCAPHRSTRAHAGRRVRRREMLTCRLFQRASLPAQVTGDLSKTPISDFQVFCWRVRVGLFSALQPKFPDECS